MTTWLQAGPTPSGNELRVPHPSSAPVGASGYGDRSSSLGWWSMDGKPKGNHRLGSFNSPSCSYQSPTGFADHCG